MLNKQEIGLDISLTGHPRNRFQRTLILCLTQANKSSQVRFFVYNVTYAIYPSFIRSAWYVGLKPSFTAYGICEAHRKIFIPLTRAGYLHRSLEYCLCTCRSNFFTSTRIKASILFTIGVA